MEEAKRIFVVDDDPNIRLIITRYLEAEGYKVKQFVNGEQLLTAVADEEPDMVILDLMMPGIDGFEVCRTLRAKSQLPIIMVSAKDDEVDRIVGLELGSDDYLSKPFSPRELVARVKTVFRRYYAGLAVNLPSESEAAGGLRLKDIALFPEERKVICQEVDMELTAKEFDLLHFFVGHLNKAFTREQLLTQIWGFDYLGDERAIDDLVKRLRKKLKGAGSQLEITTVWGYGYKVEA
ncbi:DNA-binding response regulator [Tumebacillus algifaecis]|uniref:DNA-binding response regulator n=1 Tax=Tumebacillus algifaecis TaxID=1214604 RepID=A0A223CYK7_9BACL|nr:response regulator transcription factor [Tumebacillus algifaecis]ASS74411.1 DNA-binding response regulator [Tumebacillus algifaecis]